MRDTIDIHSNDNTLFVTGQCNNRCLMCCQPPTKKDDIDFFYQKNKKIIESAPESLSVIGISGGEPTLLDEKLFMLISLIQKKMPNTYIHILSNGRKFSDCTYTEKFTYLAKEKITLGIPLHSDSALIHDKIAGVKGAYTETMLGLYNLAANEMDIELRIVLNKQNYFRLPQMARFISKNLVFISSVAFMAMEDIGYTIKNRDFIWIEPIEYIDYLQQAVLFLSQFNFDVALFNLPLCLLPNEIKPFARKSISDWKNTFLSQCNDCTLQKDCCGLFSTSQSVYKGLKTIKTI